MSRYYGCARARSARSCKETFDQCKEGIPDVSGYPAPTASPEPPSGGYGPIEEEIPEIDIDIETDIDIPNLENPIDDIDLGNGTGVHRPDEKPDNQLIGPGTIPKPVVPERPEISAVVAEEEDASTALKPGSGKIPESKDKLSKNHLNLNVIIFLILSVQCTWSFFRCRKGRADCKKDHDDCVN